MEWLLRFNQSIQYIEDHLDKTIDYNQAAKLAFCSTFHYQRMFSYIANVSLAEYIRRRRMTLAAFDLQINQMKVIDVALKYGYDSPTSFNRAFQNIHGVSPSSARTQGISLKAFPRISFSISIKGDIEMNYRIEKKDAFKIVGVKEQMGTDNEESFAKVPLFWQKTWQSGVVPQILGLMNQAPFGLLGVCVINDNKLDYYIAVSTDQSTPLELSEYEVPECTWAIFECVGALPQAIQDLQKRIITEWLPTSGYEYANAPDIEVYTDGDQQSPAYRSEIWLPVIKKTHP